MDSRACRLEDVKGLEDVWTMKSAELHEPGKGEDKERCQISLQHNPCVATAAALTTCLTQQQRKPKKLLLESLFQPKFYKFTIRNQIDMVHGCIHLTRHYVCVVQTCHTACID